MLDESPLQRSELNSTSSRYDYFIAHPPAEQARIMWIVWAVVSGIVSFSCLLVLCGILSSRTARQNPFNLYLQFLLAPDIFYSAMCSITCALNASVGHYWSSPMCEWQSWYVVFGFCANSWMNVIIAHQLRKLLQYSYNGKRYYPPTRREILAQVAGVNLFSVFVASWTLFGASLHQANTTGGLACTPTENSRASTLFFWLAFVPAFMGIPLAYVLWVCWDVHRKKLLPISGRTREISFFFLRLGAVFVLMWLPSLILLFALEPRNIWAFWAGGTWSHLQGLVSSLFCMTKPDVKKAVIGFIRCNFSSATEGESVRKSSIISSLAGWGNERKRRFSYSRQRDGEESREDPSISHRKKRRLSSLLWGDGDCVHSQQPDSDDISHAHSHAIDMMEEEEVAEND